MRSMDPLWEWLGRTRVMRWIIEAVENWFERSGDQEYERLRTRPETPPAHDQADQLVWTDHNTTLYRLVTIGPWIRDGSTPATCINCRNQHGLALTWLSGHEHLARLECCECGASWCDPLWASKEAADYALSNSEIDLTDPSPWFSEENLRMTVTQMRYEADTDQRRREEGEDQ